MLHSRPSPVPVGADIIRPFYCSAQQPFRNGRVLPAPTQNTDRRQIPIGPHNTAPVLMNPSPRTIPVGAHSVRPHTKQPMRGSPMRFYPLETGALYRIPVQYWRCLRRARRLGAPFYRTMPHPNRRRAEVVPPYKRPDATFPANAPTPVGADIIRPHLKDCCTHHQNGHTTYRLGRPPVPTPPQCYASVTTTPTPLTKPTPRDKLPIVNLETPCPTVLPGTDTGPASHGMCSGANRRVETTEGYKNGGKGLDNGRLVTKNGNF